MNRLDLTEFVPMPGDPTYLIHPDGRCVSLKRGQPRLLKVDNRAPRPSLWTVCLAGRHMRISQLVFALFGTTSAFEETAQKEIDQRPRLSDDLVAQALMEKLWRLRLELVHHLRRQREGLAS